MKKRIIFWIFLVLYLFMLALFTYECFQDGNKASNQAGFVSNTIAKFLNLFRKEKIVVDDNFRLFVAKFVGHYLYFCALGLVSLVFYLNIPKSNYKMMILTHYIAGISFAFLSEFVAEKLTSGRHPSITDVLIDTAGLLTISLPVAIVYLIKKSKNSSS